MFALLEIVSWFLLLLPIPVISAGQDLVPAQSCTDSNTLQNLDGTFQAYSLYLDLDPDMDEYKPMLVTCGLNKDVPEECKTLVEASIQNISIAVNGTIQDRMFSRRYVPNIIQFGAVLHFDRHEQADIACVTALDGGGFLVSNNRTVSNIDELHTYTIYPKSLDVIVGKSYTLTCVTDNARGLEELSWTIWNDSDGYETPLTCREETPHQKSTCEIKNSDSYDRPFSVLTASTSQHFNSTVEYTYRCNALAVNHTHQHRMLGEAIVKVHPKRVTYNGMLIGYEYCTNGMLTYF